MALRGKLEVDIELKSNADKYWQTIRDSTTIFPKAFPHDYKSIDVLEGDGKAPGSVRHFHYAEGSQLAKSSKEKIEAADDEKKTVTYSIIEGDLLQYYTKFLGHITVIPIGEGCEVKWTADDEKKTVTYSIIEGDLLQYYAKFLGHITVIPIGEGCEVKWTAEYVKTKTDIPDPTIVKDFAVKNFLEVDDYVQTLA